MFFDFNTKKDSGITLIELIVAIGIFGMLSVFVTGAFLNIISIQTQAEKKQQIIDNFRSALDIMGKEIVSGEGFVSKEDGTEILLFSSRARPDMKRVYVEYREVGGRIMKARSDDLEGCHLQAITDPDTGEEYGAFPSKCFIPFTSEDVKVDDLTFYIHNFEEGNTLGHPIVVVTASAEIHHSGSVHSFKTSASFSPRKRLNPEDKLPSDTRPPEVEIQEVNNSPFAGNPDPVMGSKISLSGEVWDPSGSGIIRISLLNKANGYTDSITYEGCGPEENQSISVGDSVNLNTDWYDHDWFFRFKIVSNKNMVTESNTNIYFDLSSAPPDFWDYVRADGGDIRVTKADGSTLVAREVSGFNHSEKKGSLFFDSTGLSTSSNTDWYIYYGNSAATEPLADSDYGKYNVWDSNYVGVWHLNEDPSGGAVQDSTQNQNEGIIVGSMTSDQQVEGKLLKAFHFDGVDDVVRVEDSPSTSIEGDSFTLSAWVYPENIFGTIAETGRSDVGGVISKAHEDSYPNTNLERYHLAINRYGGVNVRRYSSGSLARLDTDDDDVVGNQWQYLVGRYDGSELHAYVDGLIRGNLPASGNIDQSERDLLFGRRYDSRYYNGRIDEIRISDVARSAGWITTEHNNQNNHGGFWTIGSQKMVESDYFNEEGVIVNPISLDKIKEVESSSIEWAPDSVGIDLEVAISTSNSEVPISWVTASNGGSVSVIAIGEDLSGKYLWIRKTGSDELESLSVLVSGTRAVCETDLGWHFSDVELVTGMQENEIVVTATNYFGISGSDKVTVYSEEPPPYPAPPEVETEYMCDLSSVSEVNHVEVTITANEQAGPFNRYEIKRDNVLIEVILKDNISETVYIDADGVLETGQNYIYEVRAVNTEWSYDLESNWTSNTLQIPLDACLPHVESLSAELKCSNKAEPYVVGDVVGEVGAKFKVYRNGSFVDEGGLSLTNFSWQDPPGSDLSLPQGEGLGGGFYKYSAQGCYGDGCLSFPELDTDPFNFTSDVCVPPESFINLHSDPKCDRDGDGNLSISVAFDVDSYEPTPDNIRDFTDHLLYKCSDGSCGGISADSFFGRCYEGHGSECAVFHYQRGGGIKGHYHLTRTYNSNFDVDNSFPDYSLGPDSDVYSLTIDHDMCEYEWEDDPYGEDVVARLQCNEDQDDDFREILVSITDNNNPDPYSIYEVYKCTSASAGSCSATPLGQCLWTERNECAVDSGPADNTTHYYGARLCEPDGLNCGSFKFGSEYVGLDECVPTTPQISYYETEDDDGCVHPEDQYQKVNLAAYSDDSSGNVYINIYKEGSLIGSGLSQGETAVDSEAVAGQTYTYGFEACNDYSLGDTCGDIVYGNHTVVENICSPTAPSELELRPICDFNRSEIIGVETSASGSSYNYGYSIERYQPPSGFSCSYNVGDYDFNTCTDWFDTPITGSVNYTYRSNSYRDGIESPYKYQNINLNPSVDCPSQFELQGEQIIMVSITGSGGTTQSSATQIEVSAVEGFGDAVYFSVDNIEIKMEGVMSSRIDEGDIGLHLVNGEIEYPYSDKVSFYVSIPDVDYLEGMNEAHGATFTITGVSENGLESEIAVALIIRYQGGTIE